MRFKGWTRERVAEELGLGDVHANDQRILLIQNTDHADMRTRLVDLQCSFGAPLEVSDKFVDDAQSTYVLVFSRGTTPGVGAVAMVFVEPKETSTNTRVDAPQGCPGLLDFTVDIKEDASISLPVAGPWLIDWSGVVNDSAGLPLDFNNIDRVLVGFYQGLTVPELEATILDVELIATVMYEAPHDGKLNADLALAREIDSGALFAGFDRTDGTWLLALMCSTCQNPAPSILSVIQPR